MGWGSHHEINVTAVDVGRACAARSGGHRLRRDATLGLNRRDVCRLVEQALKVTVGCK